jgi:hypothetical protein
MKLRRSLTVLVAGGALLAMTGGSIAQAEMMPAGEVLSYEEGLRQWSSAGYRVQAGHIYLFSLHRELAVMAEGNVEVAGVTIGDVDGDGVTGYAEGLRRFASEGYRIHSGFVNTSSLVRR